MPEDGGRGGVLPDDFQGVHRTELVATDAARFVGEACVSIHQRGFDFERGRTVHTVPVDDVGNFKAREADLADAFHLVVEVVAFNSLLTANVREDAVARPLADVDRLSVPRVDEAVDIGL